MVCPEDAGLGAVPLQRANAASPFRRLGSQTSSLAAEIGPTPYSSRSVGSRELISSTLSDRPDRRDPARHDTDGENPLFALQSRIWSSPLHGNRGKRPTRQSTTRCQLNLP